MALFAAIGLFPAGGAVAAPVPDPARVAIVQSALATVTRMERLIVEAADRGLELVTALSLAGPFAVGVALEGLQDLEFEKRRVIRLIATNLVLATTYIPADATEAGDHMRRAFDQLRMSAGFDDGSPSCAQSGGAGYTE